VPLAVHPAKTFTHLTHTIVRNAAEPEKRFQKGGGALLVGGYGRFHGA
jgi:uncharacterized membrane protein